MHGAFAIPMVHAKQKKIKGQRPLSYFLRALRANFHELCVNFLLSSPFVKRIYCVNHFFTENFAL